MRELLSLNWTTPNQNQGDHDAPKHPTRHLRQAVAAFVMPCFFVPLAQAQRLPEPSEYLKAPNFKALGPKAKTPWPSS